MKFPPAEQLQKEDSMWKIQDEDGLVLVDVVTRIRPIDTNDAVIGIGSIEKTVKLFKSEGDALKWIADHNLIGCSAVEQAA